ncbi:Histidine kinase-, DNA gyrase B-, and HSP90-like ATPase [anaerobic digester metagenome]
MDAILFSNKVMKDLSLHILDIAQNSITAKATLIQIAIVEDTVADTYTITITDNGCGIPPEMLAKVTDPYTTSRTTRKVGLGIPLFKQNAERTGGQLTLESEVGKGTVLTAVFVRSNIDRPILGDIAGVVVILVSANPKIDFVYSHSVNSNCYVFDTREVREALDGLPLNEPSVIPLLKEMIASNLEELQIG